MRVATQKCHDGHTIGSIGRIHFSRGMRRHVVKLPQRMSLLKQQVLRLTGGLLLLRRRQLTDIKGQRPALCFIQTGIGLHRRAFQSVGNGIVESEHRTVLVALPFSKVCRRRFH